jgi:hypothetical protein
MPTKTGMSPGLALTGVRAPAFGIFFDWLIVDWVIFDWLNLLVIPSVQVVLAPMMT